MPVTAPAPAAARAAPARRSRGEPDAEEQAREVRVAQLAARAAVEVEACRLARQQHAAQPVAAGDVGEQPVHRLQPVGGAIGGDRLLAAHLLDRPLGDQAADEAARVLQFQRQRRAPPSIGVDHGRRPQPGVVDVQAEEAQPPLPLQPRGRPARCDLGRRRAGPRHAGQRGGCGERGGVGQQLTA